MTRILIRVCVDIQRWQKRMTPVDTLPETPTGEDSCAALREAVEVDPALEGLDRLYVQEVVRRLVQLNGDVLSRLVDDEEF